MLSRLIRSISGSGGAAAGNIYVGLMGGLGNQLFQYAFARFLAAQGVAVSGLVTNLFDGDKYARRPLVQAVARLPAVQLSREDISKLDLLADENGMAVRDVLLGGARTNVFCRGYWQDPRYADAVAGELVADLQAFGERHRGAAADACVLHVRRHDYGHHGLLPLRYYRAALEACGSPRFTVVTDEPNFCEYVFARVPGYAGVARGEIADPWHDFFRMAAARVQIIANSSFSWWTAWLGSASGATGTVIAPAEWSLIGNANCCPAAWQRIDVPLARP